MKIQLLKKSNTISKPSRPVFEARSRLAPWLLWSASAVLLGAVALPSTAHAAPPAAPAAAPVARGGEDAALNFVGAEIESVIKAVGHYTNITFIIDPRVKGNINLVSEKSISKAQAFSLLASALRLQGYAVVSGDGFAKVVPEGDAKLQPGPTQVGIGESGVKGDQIATQIFRLNYESSMNLVTILRPLISPNNTINANPGNNTLVITDYADNLKRLGKIISALDAPANGDLDIIPVRNAVASDIAVMVNKLMEPSAGADSGRVTVLADPRTNALILRAPSVARANLAKSLIGKLDQPTPHAGNVHVVYLKNADATKLAQTLRAVMSGDTSAPTSSTPSFSPASASAAVNSPGGASPSQGGAQSSPATGGAAGFIQADSATNTLIITASEAVYRNLRGVIDQLDARRAQVYIESLIVEVSASKASEFGIQWLGLSGNESSDYRIGGAMTVKTNNIIEQVQKKLPATGFSIGIFRQINGALGLGALAHAMEADGNANILSTPTMITLDNEEAKIIVGQNVPFITGQFTSAASGTAGANPFQTIERKDVGLTLRVKPQISEGGTIKMAIFQETSSVDTTTLNSPGGVSTSKRSIETNVLADDGQIIVLGGLIEDNTSDVIEKVPGLSDLPVLGNLFKSRARERRKVNLMVFLRPVVIRSKEQSATIATDRYDYMRSSGNETQPEQTSVLPNLGTPQLPQLEKGRPLDGNTIRSILTPSKPNGNAAEPAGTPK